MLHYDRGVGRGAGVAGLAQRHAAVAGRVAFPVRLLRLVRVEDHFRADVAVALGLSLHGVRLLHVRPAAHIVDGDVRAAVFFPLLFFERLVALVDVAAVFDCEGAMTVRLRLCNDHLVFPSLVTHRQVTAKGRKVVRPSFNAVLRFSNKARLFTQSFVNWNSARGSAPLRRHTTSNGM